jgi:putative DNA primase/helicase
MLEPLVYSSAIIVDENDVGTFIDKAANLKAVITGDSILVNRKYKAPIIVNFRGFMVQCLNEMARIKDKSDSFFKRQLFIPFTKSFMNTERKYIKDEYLRRKEVLEYVLYRVLNMNYYELPVPKACVDALESYKEFVDPVRAFMIEMMPLFQWDLLPYQFLYDLFVAWYHRTSGGDRNIRGRSSFIKDVRKLVAQLYPDWDCTGDAPVRSGLRMSNPEPLILQYDLKDWMNPIYSKSGKPEDKCMPLLLEKYKGIYKK